jgi:amidophosphoribosyltransferase
MATQKDFVAQGRSVDEVRQAIGADHLVYLELDRMVDCARVGNPEIKGFCTGCFTGEYPTADAVEHIDALSAERASARD